MSKLTGTLTDGSYRDCNKCGRQVHESMNCLCEAYGLSPVKKEDTVNHPSYYGGENNVYEAIKVIEAWNLGFALGNAVKYISRAGKKDASKELEDLEKARWYIERRVSQLSRSKP